MNKTKRKTKKIISFILASKIKKYLEKNLTNEVKDLHTKKCKTLLRFKKNYFMD